METLKDIFFFVGSALGILAFLRTITEPAFSENRDKWSAITKKLSEQDLIDLQWQTYVRRRVERELLNKVHTLVDDIEHDAEYLRLGPPFRRLLNKHKIAFAKHYWLYRDFVQVPYWQPRYEEGEGGEQAWWEFDKDYFYRHVEQGHNKYAGHLRSASDEVDNMRYHYRALSTLTNLHSFEAPFARLTYKKRSALPLR